MRDILKQLGIEKVNSCAFTGKKWLKCGDELLESHSPIDGRLLGTVRKGRAEDYEKVIEQAREAFLFWRQVPAPKRGEVVRQIGEELRRRKKELGALVTVENGKLLAEGEGEVQEVIDVCDMAVGQSRMLYGLTMHSERPGHRMYEQWHPLGPIGVITAFNFPVAVLGWNAMIALVAGDTVIWKPSHKVPLTAIALSQLIGRVLEANGLPEGIFSLLIGDREDIGERMINDPRLPLISATGSVAMGRRIGQVVGRRLGRAILELGGNNGIIVMPSADLELAVRAILFGAVGTAGQRCTSTRRLIVHEQIYDVLVERLTAAYRQVRIGNPLEEGVLMGPLIDIEAVDKMQKALKELKKQGGRVIYGGEVLKGEPYDAGTYVTPCLAEATGAMPLVSEETFAPILYLMKAANLEEAIALHNAVPQGLSSAIFTSDLRESEAFLAHAGSDCGIANVNIGTSGAEIGGAFGGEKNTGGGRESGSDSWKAYMRRQTNTLNWSKELPLAQGISFGD
ncbi:aldehyde dehydrogenase [Desulfuromonas versatilis]|uniref:Aldehyde dehydrogenase n=1 Tax=Desulfuromonas versatilis TaxID=2802975 RepID=A0ABM8HS36_9BACT|nr:aldehyde dehydrogenase family protein [Desulfuromonas versatilis]BCR03440.1 aldehyde dehydrogenase [Desulfuromonas versatilis]